MIRFEHGELEDDVLVRDETGKRVRAKDLPMGVSAKRGRKSLGRKEQELIYITAPPSSRRARPRNEQVAWLTDEQGNEHLVQVEIKE